MWASSCVEVADAEEPVQDAGELVPVQVAGLREAEGQITVAADLASE